MNTWLSLTLLVGAIGLSWSSLRAAPLWGGGVDWNVLSFRPIAEEETPSFYGYGLELQAGYRIMNELGLGVFASYDILNEGAAKFFTGESSQFGYGMELAGRFEESVYLALRYGNSQISTQGEGISEDFLGDWDASVWGGSIGGFWRSDRDEYFQVGLQYLNGFAARPAIDGQNLFERRVDMISFYVTYLSMEKVSSRRPFSFN